MSDVIASRLSGFGTTIFTEMSALAERTGSINLGQGFPDFDGPGEVLEAAAAAMRAGHNQYAPLAGVPALREAIAAHQARFYGLEVEDVQVTFGATEAIAAAMLGLLEPGDEVIVFEPLYDSYAASIAMAGARRRVVTLRPPDWAFDPDELAAAVSARTRLVLLNSPHNPTGKVFSRDELETVAALCREHDLVALSDEVYEHLVYEGVHVPLATLEGMAERTLTISSLGKTFSVTGWKTGWATGPRDAGGRRAGGQAVPLVRGRHAVPARGRRGAGARRRLLRGADGELRGQARPPVRRVGGRRARAAAPGGHLLRQRPRRRRRGRVLPRAAAPGGRGGDPDGESSTTIRRSAGSSCASRSASATA